MNTNILTTYLGILINNKNNILGLLGRLYSKNNINLFSENYDITYNKINIIINNINVNIKYIKNKMINENNYNNSVKKEIENIFSLLDKIKDEINTQNTIIEKTIIQNSLDNIISNIINIFYIFSKKPTSVKEQILILYNRGLIINNKYEYNILKQYLYEIGYYNLTPYFKYFYKDKFNKKNNNHKIDIFQNKTHIMDIINYYNKNILEGNNILKKIFKIETYLKNKLVYFLVHNTNDNLSNNTVLGLNYYKSGYEKDELEKIISKYIKKLKIHFQNSSFHVLDSYYIQSIPKYNKEFPLWTIIPKLTLGELLFFLKQIDNDILLKYIYNMGFINIYNKKNKTNQKKSKIFLDNIQLITDLRNILSHNGYFKSLSFPFNKYDGEDILLIVDKLYNIIGNKKS